MILSCIRRIDNALGHSSTVTMAVRVLRGSRDRQLLECGLDSLSTYGLMRTYSGKEVRELIAHLRSIGLVAYGNNEVISLTPAASGVLFRGDPVTVTMDEAELEERFPQSGTVCVDSKLLKALKDLRTQVAKEEGVPAFVVFSNATLEDMARKHPRTLEEFYTVSGVGRVKAERYADRFLDLLEHS